MIQRVYEQAIQSQSLDQVVVATDDERILAHVRTFGGNVLMTAGTHQSGTDRCAEVLTVYSGFDVAINIQGDEPYIDPAQIDLLVSCFDNKHVQIATLIKRISTAEELFNTGIPKVVVNRTGQAIYFSRQTIPFQRNAPSQDWLHLHPYYKHIGIYGYRSAILAELTKLPVSSLEQAEALEQLRWLENGYHIQTAETKVETIAVDTPEDLDRLKAMKQ
ncbi:3-deoxy-manno-octulosonate cytidylyltransferase (CMP-KDO synthetase) [Parapedobacter luteus]|uniref:3-deoxy-manno-octulosonate cytidylyltransferase (CMP-KDO synthetase) n=2 Tax=Sphingobacteriaceae TaxID=84566 RepID=A0A1T5AIU7_9SPHI|nr:3-deoxy-manno-octulosonate cytidylyltransferase (CMP-KDO synthetase) [Parapedobacter luteus]